MVSTSIRPKFGTIVIFADFIMKQFPTTSAAFKIKYTNYINPQKIQLFGYNVLKFSYFKDFNLGNPPKMY